MTERQTYESNLSPVEVRQRLAGRLLPRESFVEGLFRSAEALANPLADRPEGIRFVGSVTHDSFDLMRWMPGRNSFGPRLRGNFRAGGKGTIIHLDLDMTDMRIVAGVGWLVVLLFGAIW